ncbi:diguanylate cyclase (GGDEF) domain-containing protein [Paenibacillus sp. yr247]|uniref:putative bifunctional diguanylate cyclase/phosphodiesterase n=1 Tax=Paenibacillus sp. yr247 TaxID=1761880 RepID=UPI00087F0E4D|nr:EAL domain-containing protein [Paenibacillus sp. yr247]SDO01142.1 diguanylate cyclase (GGDEF) domain-containing protein [Paenibacillus sp. yr247]
MRSTLLKWKQHMKTQALAYLCVLGFFLMTLNLLSAASFSFAPHILISVLIQALISLFFVMCIRNLRLSRKEQAEKSKELAYLAYHDTLTGLPNRRLFDDRLERALLHAQRSEQLAAVMFLDMDRFKDVNDSLGHVYGDRLIRLAAERLLGCLRGSDTVYRQGGDEFTILLESFTKPEDVRVVASRIQSALEEPFILDGKPIGITASMGIALYPLDGTLPEQLLQHADEAMYAAKNRGNNQFQFYASDIDAMVKSKAHMEMELRFALENNRFELLYQPQYEITNRKLIGMEAILYWSKGNALLLTNMDWKKAAEEMGFMVPIGKWAIRTACRQMRTWQDEGYPPLRLTIAITASQFKDEHFIEEIAVVLKETGIDPMLVELDLTESITSSNVQEASEKLVMLKKFGVRIAMDDLCTGLFTRSGLEGMPLDSVKLDSTLIRDLVDDDENQLLAAAIIRMAHRLGLNLIAKGVETEEQLEYLRFLQCTEVQGKLFSSPVGPDQFLRLMNDKIINA